VDLTIDSPFKNSTSSSNSLHKTNKAATHQLKLNKMIQNSNNTNNSRKTSSQESIISSENDLKKLNLNSHNTSNKSPSNSINQSGSNNTWKIKAVVENRNFLIPVP
jgi:hypothetical protein